MWPQIAEHMNKTPENQRTRHIRGPISTVVAYLLQAGWDPISPTEWQVANDGGPYTHSWIFQDEDLCALDQADGLLQEFEGSLALRQWKVAAEIHCGGGLEQGAYLYSLKKLSTVFNTLPRAGSWQS